VAVILALLVPRGNNPPLEIGATFAIRAVNSIFPSI